jgi:hypothetical protein
MYGFENARMSDQGWLLMDLTDRELQEELAIVLNPAV